jgi:FeS assembly SUF system regulator
MIILSKLADYGVILTTALAAAQADHLNAPCLAAQTRLPQATVAKVLKLLTRAGIVTAARGAGGGYRLAKEAEDVSVAEIVAAIDGDLALTQCTVHGDVNHPGACERDQFCSTRPHWARINAAVDHALRQITLAEMVRDAPPATAAQRLFAAYAPETPSLETAP